MGIKGLGESRIDRPKMPIKGIGERKTAKGFGQVLNDASWGSTSRIQGKQKLAKPQSDGTLLSKAEEDAIIRQVALQLRQLGL